MVVMSTGTAVRAASLLLALLWSACGEYSDRAPQLEPVSKDSQAPYRPLALPEMAESSLKYYLIAADALAHDRFAEAGVALGKLVGYADKALQPLATTAAGARGIQELRRAFAPLSAKMLDTELPEGYAVAFCHMAFDNEGGHWMQPEGEIMNPYFGAGMLHCGAFKTRE